MTELPPLLKWTTAVIAGGGAAGLTQGITSLLRLKSTALTAGLGNPVVATGELAGALGVSLLALAAPLLAVALVALFCFLAIRVLRRLLRSAARAPAVVRPAPGPARCAPRFASQLGRGTSRPPPAGTRERRRRPGGSSAGARRMAPTGASIDFSFTGRMASRPCSTSSSATWYGMTPMQSDLRSSTRLVRIETDSMTFFGAARPRPDEGAVDLAAQGRLRQAAEPRLRGKLAQCEPALARERVAAARHQAHRLRIELLVHQARCCGPPRAAGRAPCPDRPGAVPA